MPSRSAGTPVSYTHLDVYKRQVANGVVKMHIDTATQYAFSRSIADTVLPNYDGFLKVDGEVGNKKIYDPRAWGKLAETAMAARVVEATTELGSAGHSGN